jgi:exosortase
MIMLKITWPLKQLAAHGGYYALTVLGVDVRLTGTVLHVTAGDVVHPLDVADACSGMRMVVAFVALSVAVAFFSCRQWWQRAAVVLISVPVALFMNVIRVAVLAYLTLWNPDLSVGGAHSLIGTLLLIPAFGLFMLFVWVFKQITPDADETGGST